METLRQQLFGMGYTTDELAVTSGWALPLIEDYLTTIDNVEKIADYLDITGVNMLWPVTANYVTIGTDGTILANGLANTVDVSLDPEPVEGQRHMIKCVDATFACQVLPNGIAVDGSLLAIPLVLHQTIEVVYDGTEWWIV